MRAPNILGRGLLLLALAVAISSPARADAAKKNYRLHCMGCHQADGSGSPDNGIPSMLDEVGHFLAVPGGRAYLSQVPGTLNTPLSDAETAELLNWVLLNIGRQSTPADFRRYTALDVKNYRASIPEDIPGMRVKLLEQMTPGKKAD